MHLEYLFSSALRQRRPRADMHYQWRPLGGVCMTAARNGNKGRSEAGNCSGNSNFRVYPFSPRSSLLELGPMRMVVELHIW